MKVGIIGIGQISKNHIHALKECGHEIVALCDIERARCEAACESFGLSAAIYTDYVQMLDEIAPDAVHICTPHYLHTPMCCEALARDIHVLCEKPLAISEEQLDLLEKAVKASKAVIGVCHQNRYNAPIRYAKKLLEETDLSATEIGEMCGYDDHVLFFKAFKKQEGVTPITFRKQTQKPTGAVGNMKK